MGLVAALLLLAATQTTAPDRIETTSIRRAVASIKAADPGWTFIGGICDCPPLMDEQRGVDMAVWERAGGAERERVTVMVFRIAQPEPAARWLDRVRQGRVADGWTPASFDLADQAVLSGYEDGKQFDLVFRRGALLTKVHANSRPARSSSHLPAPRDRRRTGRALIRTPLRQAGWR
jgi:hypothetical protein